MPPVDREVIPSVGPALWRGEQTEILCTRYANVFFFPLFFFFFVCYIGNVYYTYIPPSDRPISKFINEFLPLAVYIHTYYSGNYLIAKLVVLAETILVGKVFVSKRNFLIYDSLRRFPRNFAGRL